MVREGQRIVDSRVDIRLQRHAHREALARRDVRIGREVVRQRGALAAQRPEQPVRVVFRAHARRAGGARAHRAVLDPRAGRLDAGRAVIAEREAHADDGRERRQMTVAQPVALDRVADRVRQRRPRAQRVEMRVAVAQRIRAALGGELGRRRVRVVAQVGRDVARHLARGRRIVAQPHHREHVREPRHADADPPLLIRLARMRGERPARDVERVVEQAHLDAHGRVERGEIEARLAAGAERIAHEARQIDRAEHRAAVGRQRLRAARARRVDPLAAAQRIGGVDRIDEYEAGPRAVARGRHDLAPHVARGHARVRPCAVRAGQRAARRVARRRHVPQRPRQILLDRLHECVGGGHRELERRPARMPARMPVLRGGEREQIRVIAAQHRELRAAAAVALARLRADPVEPVERRAHAGRIGMVRVGPRAGGRDGREVVADVGAHREREARFVERLVEVRMKARERGGGADRMHEAARHRLIRRGARARHDAARAERAVQQVPVEAPRRARTGRHRLRERERTRDPRARLSARMLAGQRVAVGEYGVADRLVVHVADHADERIGVGNGARAFVDRPQAACASRAVRRAARRAVRRAVRRAARQATWRVVR